MTIAAITTTHTIVIIFTYCLFLTIIDILPSSFSSVLNLMELLIKLEITWLILILST